jgi:DNA-binding transcriptional MerR regulator
MINQSEPRFTLKELEEASGLSARVIRSYVEKGLLPGAIGKGPSAFYTPAHVETLSRINEYKSRGYSLSEIRAELAPRPEVRPRHQSEDWRRVILQPGVELHVRRDAEDRARPLIDGIEDLAARWPETFSDA